MKIYYTITAPLVSPDGFEWGHLLAAKTDEGLCAVYLGDNEQAMTDMLMGDYPRGGLIDNAEALTAEVTALRRYLTDAEPLPALPIDLEGTAFQKQIWALLRAIPFGETRTYQQLSEELGDTNATRAVGTAVGNNPAALVVPCHRVLRSDGGLGGFRWGVERKEALLKMEQVYK